ncbi:glycerol-3-phosphate acyltransferase [Sporosarcina pasteurii]|uniref:Glycerol-3-phosphate acyltransferase n=1 Tax=Sporosarcina pasteurii TaxID=1474 RepID=A0A380BSV8_SPOPA|nr:glycerol-3-phosphate acyltransferase [Sporosarcina pasteurii]MDS9471262.1 glycerol-3-phosphate acyltransferase [Sporosarcina pasteurii]QBQ05106.1 glycerol-3-phosphate acyltransferase [Sporosarcina pasteurii]SUJ06504.1 G3P acyltransferase [Sporosarcina pasteurii]
MFLLLFVILILSYLIGCLHGSIVAQKLSGVNLKDTGVKNAGASNATIVLGKKYGALVAAIDIGKGALTIILLRYTLNWNTISPEILVTFIFSAGAAVILGHVFPFYMKFNGGKGTATIIGVLLALHWGLGLIALAIFIIATLVTDFIVFGVFTLYLSLIVIAIWKFSSLWTVLISVILLIIALYKHMENFKRMKVGEEKRVSAVFRKSK